MKLGTQVGLGPGHIVLDGDPGPPPANGFGNVSCAKTAAWIKMPLSMEVGLGTGHIVLDGTQLPSPKKGTQSSIFGPYLL